MQKILQFSARKWLCYSVCVWVSCSLVLWLVGAALFFVCEQPQGWSYFDSVYFTFIAILAIGYGDFTLQSNSGKALFVLWSLIVVPTLTMLITTAVEAVGTPYLVRPNGWINRNILGNSSEKPDHSSGNFTILPSGGGLYADMSTFRHYDDSTNRRTPS